MGLNDVFLITMGIILLGFILKKTGIATEEHGKFLARLAFYITIPAVIFITITSIEVNFSLLSFPLIILIYSSIIWGLTYFIIFKKSKDQKGLYLLTILGFNVHNFGFPIVEGIWGSVGLSYLAMWGAGNSIIVFGLLYILAAKYSPENLSLSSGKQVLYQLLHSIPLLTLILAILISLLNISIPIVINDFSQILARANSAIVLLLLGILLDFKISKEKWIDITNILVIRYVFGILIGLILFWLLPFDHFLRIIILISLILPVGLSITTYAVEFDHDLQLIGIITNLSIIISFFLIWALLIILGSGI